MGNMKFLLLISLLISNIVFAKEIILYPIFETEPVFTSMMPKMIQHFGTIKLIQNKVLFLVQIKKLAYTHLP